ncbi:MAG: ABC transporter permease [Phycisphaerales bacterium]
MNFIALKMLFGDRGKFLGVILGLTLASFLITQQSSIFVGIMTRTVGFLSDTAQPDIWVMDAKVQFIDDIKPMSDTMLYRVRGVEGVEWAVPLYKGLLRARLQNGNFQQCVVIGLDDTTLMGGPPEMVEGTLEDLRRSEGVIVDITGAVGRLAKMPEGPDGKPVPGAKPIPLKIGDTLELNDRRAVVVGICRSARTFQNQPTIYTTYTRATRYAPRERKLLSFVMAKALPGQDLATLAQRIRSQTGLTALTQSEFSWKTIFYFMKYTGIPINFGFAVGLAFLVGTAIAGQTFYAFTLDNIRHFGALKAMGATNARLLGMIILQALVVGVIGYGLGVGAASSFAILSKVSELAFRLLWQTLAITAAAIAVICVLSALVSIWKVMRLEPAIVFKG